MKRLATIFAVMLAMLPLLICPCALASPPASFTDYFEADSGYTSGTSWTSGTASGRDIIAAAGAGTWPSKVTVNGLTCLRGGGSVRLALPSSIAWSRQSMSLFIVCRLAGAGLTSKGAVYGNNSGTIIQIEDPTTLKAAVYNGAYQDSFRMSDGIVLWGFRLSATNAKIVYGPEEASLGAFSSGSGTGGTLFAQDAAGNNAASADIFGIYLAATAVSDADLASLRSYCVSKWGTGSSVKGDAIVYAGDSLMQGFGITTPTTDNYLPALLDQYCRTHGISNPMWINVGKSGWVTGIPALTSITGDGATRTATFTNHGFTNGDSVTVAGSTVSADNASHTITVVDANTFTYSGTSNTTATTSAGTSITASDANTTCTYGAFRGSPDTTVKSLWGDLNLSNATVANMTSWVTAHSGYNRIILLTDGGINDVITSATGDQCTATQVYNRQKAYRTKALAIGATHLFQTTITPPGTDSTANTARLSDNANLAGDSNYSGRLIDLAGDSRFQDNANTTYFQADKLHFTGGPTPSGDDAAAQIVYSDLYVSVPPRIGMGVLGFGGASPSIRVGKARANP